MLFIDAHLEAPDDRVVVTAFPIPVWIRAEQDRFVAELYGHPCIYADGDTERSAITSVACLMYGYFQDFKKHAEGELSAELNRLRLDLQKYFR